MKNEGVFILKQIYDKYQQTSEILQEKMARLKEAIKVLQDDEKFIKGIKERFPDEKLIAKILEKEEGILPGLPFYPVKGNLLEKVKYYQEVKNRFWSVQELKDFIEQNEGEKAKKTLQNLSFKLNYYSNKFKLIILKYNNSNKYTFYSTDYDTIELTPWNKDEPARIKHGYEPSPELLENLSEEQLSTKRMRWNGIETDK